MRQSKRSFVERIDFRTSPGNLGGAETAERIRREQGWMGSGPSVVVTDLGIYHFGADGEMRLDSLHPGATMRIEFIAPGGSCRRNREKVAALLFPPRVLGPFFEAWHRHCW